MSKGNAHSKFNLTDISLSSSLTLSTFRAQDQDISSIEQCSFILDKEDEVSGCMTQQNNEQKVCTRCEQYHLTYRCDKCANIEFCSKCYDVVHVHFKFQDHVKLAANQNMGVKGKKKQGKGYDKWKVIGRQIECKNIKNDSSGVYRENTKNEFNENLKVFQVKSRLFQNSVKTFSYEIHQKWKIIQKQVQNQYQKLLQKLEEKYRMIRQQIQIKKVKDMLKYKSYQKRLGNIKDFQVNLVSIELLSYKEIKQLSTKMLLFCSQLSKCTIIKESTTDMNTMKESLVNLKNSIHSMNLNKFMKGQQNQERKILNYKNSRLNEVQVNNKTVNNKMDTKLLFANFNNKKNKRMFDTVVNHGMSTFSIEDQNDVCQKLKKIKSQTTISVYSDKKVISQSTKDFGELKKSQIIFS